MRYSDYLNQVAVRHRTASFNDLTRLSPGAPQPIDVSFKQAIGLLWPYTATRIICLLYTSPSPRDRSLSRMPSSA